MSLAAVNQPNAQKYIIDIPEGGPWTRDTSFEHTFQHAIAEPANDKWAYRFLSPALRPYVATIYSFARYTHDFGAEPRYEGVREEALDAWEQALHDCLHGKATHPCFIALAETVEKFSLPITPFHDYIIGARMNASVRRYSSFNQLLGYCEKAANSLGRIVLQIAGSTEPDDIRAMDDCSTAMMLNNFWAHCARDFNRGRIYIPEEDLRRFGVTESDLKQRRVTPELRALMDYQVARTRLYLKRGRPLFNRLPRALQAEMQIVWLVVTVACDNIESDNFDVFKRGHDLRTQDWARAAARLAMWRLKDFTQW